MENMAILAGLILKYTIAVITVFGVATWLLVARHGKPHWFLTMVTSFFVCLSLYIFGGGYLHQRAVMNEVAGDYKLRYYKCDECPECIVRLKKDGTYVLLKSGKAVDKGSWSFTEDFSIFLKIENGSHETFDESRTLSSIKNNNCRDYWYQQELKQELNGRVIIIDTPIINERGYSFTVMDAVSYDEVKFAPHVLLNNCLEEKLKVGDKIKKDANSTAFEVTSVDGTVFRVSDDSCYEVHSSATPNLHNAK